MKSFLILAIFLAFNSHADSSKNPVQRYFRKIPIEEARLTWGNASATILPKTSLDVLVWNVKKGNNKSFDGEFKKFGSQKELFLIQEAYTAPFFTQTIEAFTDYQWELGLSFRYRMYNNEATGNMIGGIVRPTWVRIEHTINMEPVTKTPKTTIYAKYAVEESEKELLVISMHGINFNGLNAYIRQLEQIGKVISSHDGPVIFAGDFNTRTDERELEMRNFAKNFSLKEVDFQNGGARMRAYGSKHFLDYAFVRGLEVKEALVHGSSGSDHQPMTLNLDFL